MLCENTGTLVFKKNFPFSALANKPNVDLINKG